VSAPLVGFRHPHQSLQLLTESLRDFDMKWNRHHGILSVVWFLHTFYHITSDRIACQRCGNRL